MNNERSKSSVMIALIALAVYALCSGCKSPESAMYQSLNATKTIANASLSGWGDYCRSVEGSPNRVPLQTHIAVKEKWDAYQSFWKAAKISVLAYKDAQAIYDSSKTGAEPDISIPTKAIGLAHKFALDLVRYIEDIKHKGNR